MNEKGEYRQKIGWILMIVAIALFLILEMGNRCLNSPMVCARLVQRSVYNIERNIQNLIDNNADYHQYEKQDIGLFVFHKDSLLYWNNNAVGPKLIRRKVSMENDTICNLLSGDYYVKTFSKGNLDYYVFKLLNTTYRLENRYFENRYQPYHRLVNDKILFGSNDGFQILSKKGKCLSTCQITQRKISRPHYWRTLLIIDLSLFIIGVIIVVSRFQKSKTTRKFNIKYSIGLIILAAIVCTYLYYEYNKKKENQEMASLAEHIMEKRDIDFETSYEKFAIDVKEDSTLREMIFAESNVLSDVILGYTKELLFDETMRNYHATLTICSPEEEITIQPDNYVSNCDDYFLNKLATNQQKRVGEGLYFIDYYTLDPNYLGKIKMLSKDTLQRTLYFEFYKPIAPVGFGFPQLLQEDNSDKPYDYSVANYKDNVLVYKYGKYIYPNFFKDQKGKNYDFNYAQGYKHYSIIEENGNAIVISTLRKDWKEIAAPFALFFLGILSLFLFFYWLFNPKENWHERKGSFRQRLQNMILLTIGISFFTIGPVSIVYMRSLYNQKTADTQFETTLTLANEMNNSIDFEHLIATANRNTWTEILQQFANTFFTDLNLYSVDGRLIATSRQEIYELILQAPIMNAKAYQSMFRNKALYYTHEERLGKGKYESAYIPITDKQGNTLAFLNTPYFSSATDLQKEIKNFVLTYINFNLIFLGLALILVLSLTKRLMEPLSLIQEKMRGIKIDKKNEPIEWTGNDEIGALIKQYNQLIVELEKSAAELKRTTTESAWRGVARQVAHEIKNSLTPMRLSVQMLQRNIENGKATPEQTQRIANTLIEQIDALSDIASSFSRYAKLPENNPVPLDLAELVGNVVNLYDNAENIAFAYIYDKEKDHTYNGDKTNLNSAVGNLIKNAVQAIGSKSDGKIEVRLEASGSAFTIAVKDNGKGIKEEDKSQIFLPNFTTKTGGSGVGLSLTYNIVQAAGGTISFESEVGEGTEFIVVLPKNSVPLPPEN